MSHQKVSGVLYTLVFLNVRFHRYSQADKKQFGLYFLLKFLHFVTVIRVIKKPKTFYDILINNVLHSKYNFTLP